MASDNQNFSGWSGKTKNFNGESPYEFFKNKTQSVSIPNQSITVGPVNIDRNRPKKSQITPGVKQTPVVIEKTQANPDFSKGKKLGVKPNMVSRISMVSLNLPFTAGTVDTTFPSGPNTGLQDNGTVHTIKTLSDGKILIGGDFNYYDYNGDTYYAPYFLKLNSDGSPDLNFQYTFQAWDNSWYLDNTVQTIEIQSDGKILLGGQFDWYYGDQNFYTPGIVRFNSDGTFDDTFFVGDGFNNTVYKIIAQPDGKILVAGDFTSYNNNDNWRIIRLNSNGVKDNSFNAGDGIDWDDFGIVYDMVLQSDGKIILGGDFYNYNGYNSDHIVRINSNGSYDNTFVVGDGFNDIVRALALQSDGKIIVGGDFNDYNNVDLYNGYIVRLGVNGEMDARFGYGLNNTVREITIQSDDKILVGGYMGTFYIDNNTSLSIDELVRFHSDCTFDYSFYYGELFDNAVFAIELDADNKIYVGGDFNEDIEADPNFVLNQIGRLNNAILEYPYTYVVEDCNEPINGSPIYYTVGSMTELNTNSTYSFRKLSNPSVTVCGTINLDLYPSNIIDYEVVGEYNNCGNALFDNSNIAYVSDMLDLGEGYNLLVDKKYVAGDILYVDLVFDFIGGLAFIKTVVQINQIVPTDNNNYFSSAIIPYQPYQSVTEAVNVNGIHYEVRDTCETDSVSHYPLVHKEWYNNKSILLPTFGTIPCKEVINVHTFAPYSTISDGTEELFSVVEFNDCDECLTKMGKTGLLDTTLYNGGFDGSLVYTMVEQPDGKILVGGNFSDYDGTEVNNFMRLNSDGTLDETFFVGGFNSGGYVRAIALQSDGKILVGGNFTNYDGYNVGRIIRLNSDGSVDENFTFSTEFNNLVRAIAIQADGKILVGGEFDYYYDYYCNRIVRLNTDGTPDTTFNTGDGFNGGVFTINVESTKVLPLYRSGDEAPTYYEDIKVGGWFTEYNNQTSGGIAKLDRDGNLTDSFGIGFNFEDGEPRVNQILKQTDGKLVIVGGAADSSSSYLNNYQGTRIGQNIVRLEEDGFGNYQIDTTFDVTSGNFGEGGVQGSALSVTQQPDGKLIIGGDFDCYWDNNDNYCDLWNIVRINTDGSYDSTFSMGEGFDGQVNKVLLLSNGKLLTGGRYGDPYPTDHLTRLYIGEEYKLRDFTDCNGNEGYTYVPRTFVNSGSGSEFTSTTITYEPISTSGLDLIYDGNYDDDNFFIELPLDFDVNFLGTNYTSVYVGSNPYITFGDGSIDHGISPFPADIPNETGLPGVYISTRTGDGSCLDSAMWLLYTGTTDGGNTVIIRFEGNDDYDASQGDTNLVYNFKFYKDQSDYFDLIIEQNEFFCNDDPTGGVSNGVDETWITSFDTSSEKAYRIGILSSSNPIKVNIDETPKVCGTVGNETDTITYKGGQGGSMYFNGIDSSVTISYDSQMDLNFGPWTIEWFQYFTSDAECCLRVFDIGSNGSPEEHIGVSLENGNIFVWIEGTAHSYTLNKDIRNTWCYFAISAQNIGGDDWVLRVYQDGIQLGVDLTLNVDLNNFDGPTQLPLTIGGEGNGNSPFKGYITNFRWSKGFCYYQDPTMDVPTSPLVPYNSQLLFLSTDEAGLLTNECEVYINPNYIPASEISSNNVTWSELNPFAKELSLYNATGDVTYSGCAECLDTVYYNTSLYVRNPISVIKNEVIPNFVTNRSMTLSDIQKVQTFGPIFTTRGPESYEILNYNL